MQVFPFHVFVCDQLKPEGVPCCSARGSAAVLEELRMQVVRQGLADTVQITMCGSLGLCEHGPNLVLAYFMDTLHTSLFPTTNLPFLFIAFFGELIFMVWLFFSGSKIQDA